MKKYYRIITIFLMVLIVSVLVLFKTKVNATGENLMCYARFDFGVDDKNKSGIEDPMKASYTEKCNETYTLNISGWSYYYGYDNKGHACAVGSGTITSNFTVPADIEEVRFYVSNGGSAKITIRNHDTTTKLTSLDVSADPTLGLFDTLICDTSTVKNLIIATEGNIYIDAISYYKTNTDIASVMSSYQTKASIKFNYDTAITDPGLRFGVLLSKTDYDKFQSLGFKFGVKASYVKSEKTYSKSLVCENIARVNSYGTLNTETGDYYQYSMVILGINSSDYNLYFTAKAYIKDYDGNEFYMQSKTESFYSVLYKYKNTIYDSLSDSEKDLVDKGYSDLYAIYGDL